MRRLSYILVTITVCVSCRESCGKIDYPAYSEPDAPLMYITSTEDSCTYRVQINLWTSTWYRLLEGELTWADNAYKIRLPILGEESIRVFDFSMPVDSEYIVRFAEDVSFNAHIQWKGRIESDKSAYAFRFEHAMLEDEYDLDIVYLVCPEAGILGSYISGYFEGKETVMSPRGDLLRKYIDYSEKTIQTLM